MQNTQWKKTLKLNLSPKMEAKYFGVVKGPILENYPEKWSTSVGFSGMLANKPKPAIRIKRHGLLVTQKCTPIYGYPYS